MSYKVNVNNNIYSFEKPITILDIMNDTKVYAGNINNKVYHLNHLIDKDTIIEPIYDNSVDGKLIYMRTLDFLLICAIKKLYHKNVQIMHSISKGQFIKIEDTTPTLKIIQNIKETMDKMISDKLVIHRYTIASDRASDYFNLNDRSNVAKLITKRNSDTCSIYELDGYCDYFYGVLLPNTEYITHYSIEIYEDGLWLSSSNNKLVKQDKLFNVFKRFENEGNQLQLQTIIDLNNWIENNKFPQLIQYCEKRLYNDVTNVVKTIINNPNINMILLSGPSNSGKTTLSRIIADNLSNQGKEALYLSLDDFFLERIDTPLLPDGSYDFENITCIDLELFNSTLNDLIKGKEVYLPTFNFVTGSKTFSKEPTILKNNQYLIIEGLHALNPLTTSQIDDKYKYKLYINALTHLNIDDHNYISTSDYRLIRRMIRDYKFRNQSIQDTIRQWPKVKQGENQYIFPYQEQADAIINTSLVYEMPIFKNILLPLIEDMDKSCPEYLLAARIKRILAFFIGQDSSLVPTKSLLREFIGEYTH